MVKIEVKREIRENPLTGVSAVTTVTGHRGQSVQIRCSYDSGYETNTKYLCRGECSVLPWETKDIPIQSGSAEDQRFSLDDDTAARVFTINITDLRPEDEGTYWCAVKRPKTLPDLYTEILLLVKIGSPDVTAPHSPTHLTSTDSPPWTTPCSPDVTAPHSPTHPPSTDSPPWTTTYHIFSICGALVIMMIILLVAVMILHKHKRNTKNSKAPAETIPLHMTPVNAGEDDRIYQEIDEKQPNPAVAPTVTTIYSTADGPTDVPIYSTIDEPTNSTSTIYCTTSLPQ
ncbi:CMRF35-like molecule 5 [Pygocentrus nattereri]|uniref:CMRF35-like molecule 5 n=1 Tax=Pygocentrus nattereri TaxID=42514 RepID=UPI001891571C|nr:CMRF35-like molecule 5 [Pygocentrus nattereri]